MFNKKIQKGSVLITLVVGMILMGTLGAGIYSFTTSASFGQLMGNSDNEAYNLAKAGIRYGSSLQTTTYLPTTFLMPDANHTFTVNISGGIITSTGMVNSGTALMAAKTITTDTSWSPVTPYIPITGVTSPIVTNPSAIVPNQIAKTISIGGGVTNNDGGIWYQGSNQIGNCINGVCNFGTCLYAYFDFTSVTEDFSAGSTTNGEGFTFDLISAIKNARNRTGGAAPGIPQGELLGYAGPGTTTDKLGLIPPKIGFEFDTYPETGTSSICGTNSRNDGTPFANHTALLFWGNRTNAACGAYPGDSFDDNKHGAGGTGNDPLNPTKGTQGYYEGAGRTCKSSGNTCNWLEDGYPYSVRVEIARPTPDTATSGTFNYVINAWVIRPIDAGFTPLQTTHYQDVTAHYADSNPQISKTITLGFQDHSDLSKIFFGFTEGTGTVSQNITLSNLKVNFPIGGGTCTSAVSCSYNINPTTATLGTGAGSSAFNITAGGGCTWAASSDALWLTTAAAGTGTGSPQAVNYSYSANACSTRIGNITVGGQVFTATQTGAATPLSITTASPLPNATKNSAYSTTIAKTGGADPYTWSVSTGALPPGLTLDASTGVISGTPTTSLLYNFTISVTDNCGTVASQPFSIQVMCSSYNIWNTTGATYDFEVSGTCRTNRPNTSEITISVTQLTSGQTTKKYNAGSNCNSSLATLTYLQAATADTNGNCRVNYTPADTFTDR